MLRGEKTVLNPELPISGCLGTVSTFHRASPSSAATPTVTKFPELEEVEPLQIYVAKSSSVTFCC